MEGITRMLASLGAVLFWLLLGWWALPLMVLLPIYRLVEIVQMLATGQAPLLGSDLTLLMPPTLALYYLYTSDRLGYRLFWKVPVLRPGLLLCWILMVGTTLTAHLLYLGLLHRPELRAVVSAGGIGVLLAFRALLSWLYTRRPALSLVPPAEGGPPRPYLRSTGTLPAAR